MIELATAALVGGVFAAYYMLNVHEGMGRFSETWLTYLAHVTLLCGLLACSAVDIEHWIVPLEVCWIISLVGVVTAAISPPHPAALAPVGPITGAMGIAALAGLGISLLLLQWGLIRPSFIDADDRITTADDTDDASPIVAVAATAEKGINPRVEILHEVLFLMPAIVLAVGVWALARAAPGVERALTWPTDPAEVGALARHLVGLESAVFGYLIGGALIWGARIFGTLAFGKEAMGLGDAHLLAAVGAVTGWLTATLAFFVAPILGLVWALWLLLSRRQRELPYGPWLAVGAAVVMLAHDPLFRLIRAALGRG